MSSWVQYSCHIYIWHEYCTLELIKAFLASSDIYITPSKAQQTSQKRRDRIFKSWKIGRIAVKLFWVWPADVVMYTGRLHKSQKPSSQRSQTQELNNNKEDMYVSKKGMVGKDEAVFRNGGRIREQKGEWSQYIVSCMKLSKIKF